MRSFRAQSRLISWIAVMAVLLASLAPTLTHALGFANGSTWIEVCGAQGAKWIDAGPGHSGPAAPVKAHVFAHCPFCSMHAPVLGLPPAPVMATMPVEGYGAFPPAFYAAPATPFVWVSAQPRAPPYRA
jgi:hypothetical protein